VTDYLIFKFKDVGIDLSLVENAKKENGRGNTSSLAVLCHI